jgi:hypothetical protein
MIVGNKCDMDDKRIISTEKGVELGRHHGIPFTETSAKTNVNIEKAFYDMAKRILDKQPTGGSGASTTGATTIVPGSINDNKKTLKGINCCWSQKQ